MSGWRDHPLTISIAGGILAASLGLGAQIMLVGRWTAGVEASVERVDRRITDANEDRVDRRNENDKRLARIEGQLGTLDEAKNGNKLAIQALQQSMQQYAEIRAQLVERATSDIRSMQERLADLQRQINDGRGPIEALRDEVAKIQSDIAVVKDQLARLLGQPSRPSR